MRHDPDHDVLAALGRLDPFERQAVTLAYFGGLTQAQVADRLGQQRDTVAAAIARALRLIAGTVDR